MGRLSTVMTRITRPIGIFEAIFIKYMEISRFEGKHVYAERTVRQPIPVRREGG